MTKKIPVWCKIEKKLRERKRGSKRNEKCKKNQDQKKILKKSFKNISCHFYLGDTMSGPDTTHNRQHPREEKGMQKEIQKALYGREKGYKKESKRIMRKEKERKNETEKYLICCDGDLQNFGLPILYSFAASFNTFRRREGNEKTGSLNPRAVPLSNHTNTLEGAYRTCPSQAVV